MGAVGWADRAACKGSDVETFFEVVSEPRAKATCFGCPVSEECLAYALETRQPYGVWGGLNPEEREALRRAVVPGGVPLSTVTYTTQARSTGAVCSAGRTPEGWGATCNTHGSHATARSRSDAEKAVSRPQEWCPYCASKESSRQG